MVSGMAMGIDAAAHQGALQADRAADHCPTVAVVGTGLDQVYPRQHHGLAQDIAERGWVLSEQPIGTKPLPHHFPLRNRLIAGLSQGVLVVEAAMQSGSLITAQLALDQGKEVFAIPGSIHSALSRGCHALLRQGAKLVENIQDISEELPALVQSLRSNVSGCPPCHPSCKMKALRRCGKLWATTRSTWMCCSCELSCRWHRYLHVLQLMQDQGCVSHHGSWKLPTHYT